PWSASDALIPGVTTALADLVRDGAVVDTDGRVATLELDEAERLLADIVATLSTDAPTLDVEVADEPPEPDGDEDAPRPSDEQWQAVRLACGHRLSILTGGPGTGKTQTMRALVATLRAEKRTVLL